MIIKYLQLLSAVIFVELGCNGKESVNDQTIKNQTDQFANVTAVSVKGDANNYQFSVTITSPDRGCDQYADCWEVISLEGELIYRRILLHSHVNEQPFTRSGGPVLISADEVVWIRAHMNTEGYGGKAYRGSVIDGFIQTEMSDGFAEDLINLDPKTSCAF